MWPRNPWYGNSSAAVPMTIIDPEDLFVKKKVCELAAMVHHTAVQVSDMAVDTVYGAGKMVGAATDAAKLRLRILDRKAEVNTLLREIGELLYATHTGAPSDSDIMLAKLQEIDGLKAEITALEEKLGRKPDTCETCGAVVREDAVFCEECGEKL